MLAFVLGNTLSDLIYSPLGFVATGFGGFVTTGLIGTSLLDVGSKSGLPAFPAIASLQALDSLLYPDLPPLNCPVRGLYLCMLPYGSSISIVPRFISWLPPSPINCD